MNCGLAIWPGGSLARRPVKAMLGSSKRLEALKPTAMSPFLSWAMLASQNPVTRSPIEPSCATVGTVFGLVISYQRNDGIGLAPSRPTVVWLATRCSTPATLRHARRYIRRLARALRSSPGLGSTTRAVPQWPGAREQYVGRGVT